MKAIDDKLEADIAKLNADFDKKIAAAQDISNDPSLEVSV
jgi:hypothetical protein